MSYGKMKSINKHIFSCPLPTLPVLCLCLSLMMLPQTSCAPTTPKSTHNITVTVPEGTQSHGDLNLLCTPTKWTDIAVFFFANYVAHAATIKSLPGEPALITLQVLVSALCLPVYGVLKGVRAIRQRAVLSSTPLGTAAKAGALCVVVRTAEWVPQRGDVACVSRFQFPDKYTRDVVLKRHPTWSLSKFYYILNDLLWRSSTLNSILDHIDHKYAEYVRGEHSSNAQPPINREEVRELPQLYIEKNSIHLIPSNSIFKSTGRKVHGICCFPHGYALAILPPRAQTRELFKDKRDELEIPYISSWRQRLKDGLLKILRHSRDGRLATADVIELRVPGSQDNDHSNSDLRPEIVLSSNYNVPKGLIAIFQALYASATLYQTRDDQIQRYGCAAFGLTVAPYLVMSIINLLGTILTPDYPCVYLVRSEIMDEASRREGAKFEGMVATLISEPVTARKHVEFCIDEDNRMFIRGPRESISQRGLHDADDAVIREVVKPDTCHGNRNETLRINEFMMHLYMSCYPVLQSIPNMVRHPTVCISDGLGLRDGNLILEQPNLVDLYAGLIVGSIPIAINGVLSHFRAGQSTLAQRVWTMTWLAIGLAFGLLLGPIADDAMMVGSLPLVAYFAPAIGGFVVVAQMLMSYGRCIEIGKGNF